MRNALLTLNIGDCLRPNSRASFQAAALRWGCDYVEVTEAREGVHPHAMKLLAFELCDADRVCYLDADMVVSAGCPSPFDMFPEDAFVAAYNNQGHMDDDCLRACSDTISRDLKAIMEWRGQDEKGYYSRQFINSGFWVASRKHHAGILSLALEVAAAMDGKTAWKDQSALNYALLHTKTPLLAAPATWNYQFPPKTAGGPMRELIYHWAGGEDRNDMDGVNWRSFRRVNVSSLRQRARLLVVADHGCPTGFARVAENICAYLADRWELLVIGINYNGTPHDFPYKIWPARLYGDLWGIGTLGNLLPQLQPDAILAIQDPWIIARYATEINRGPVPMVGYMPIDARNQHPNICSQLNDLDLAMFYTKFGEVETRLAGFRGQSRVIPHGVDTEIYRPLPYEECRGRLGAFNNLTKEKVEVPERAFIVGNVNRNQPRKRLDLTLQYFAEWIKRVAGDPRQRIDDAYLYLHCAQQDDAGLDLLELAHYYGIVNRLFIPAAEFVTPAHGLPEYEMPYVYGCFDLQVSTTAGEGWGLTQMEGMACGIPQVVPQFSALGEWAAPASYAVPVSDERIAHPYISTIGAVPQKEAFIRALDMFYRKPELRKKYSELGLALVDRPEFRWKAIAEQFHKALTDMIAIARMHASERNSMQKGSDNGEIQETAGIQPGGAA